MSLGMVYRAMGWTDTQAYLRRKHPHLQLRVAAQMAVAIGVPVGPFLEELAKEEGIPPLFERVIHKPRARPSSRGLRRYKGCAKCGSREHRTRDHAKSEVSDFESQQLRAKAERQPVARGRR